MATTTFNGPVRSEKGFKQVNKNSTTGVYTSRTLGLKPDLTSLTATVVSTGTSLTYTKNVITINNYTYRIYTRSSRRISYNNTICSII